jgi:hypothetical protein
MMADPGTDRTLVTKVISPIQSYDRDTPSLHEDVGHLSRERTSSAGQGVRERGGGEQEGTQTKTIVVIEQWICLVLGLVCMASGIWGIYMKPEQDTLSAYIAWLGSLYMPTLRLMALACIGSGVALARWGWAHL